jgi:hypothetical protein
MLRRTRDRQHTPMAQSPLCVRPDASNFNQFAQQRHNYQQHGNSNNTNTKPNKRKITDSIRSVKATATASKNGERRIETRWGRWLGSCDGFRERYRLLLEEVLETTTVIGIDS